MTGPIGEPPKNNDLSPLALGAGLLIACWDFFMMFRGWVVAPQAEVIGANIVFVFLGVLPLIGIIGSFWRRMWGPRILVVCPLFASTGFLFTVNTDWQVVVAVILLFWVPTFAIGLVLFKLIRQRARVVDALKPETSN